MRTRRSLKLAIAVVAALAAAGTTFAWAGVLVGGHRADQIGTFEPIVHPLVGGTVPVAPRTTSASGRPSTATGSQPAASSTSATPYTGTSHEPVTAPATATAPTTGGRSDDAKTSTTDDNGRNNDD